MATDDIYLGNPLLKKANVPIEFTQDQVEEFIKCKEDPYTLLKITLKLSLSMRD